MARAYQPYDSLPSRPVLVVEDEFLIALMTESTLRQMGYADIIIAQTLEQGLERAETGNFAFAILDVNLEGRVSFPIASVLRQKGTPIGFQTAYGPDGVAPEFADCPVITKPFSERELSDLVDQLIDLEERD